MNTDYDVRLEATEAIDGCEVDLVDAGKLIRVVSPDGKHAWVLSRVQAKALIADLWEVRIPP